MLNQVAYATKLLVGTAVWTVGIIMAGTPVRADFLSFNPTGNAADPAATIGGIDLAPGNALARGAVPLTVGKTFELNFQSGMTGLINTNGLTFAPPGLNTSYQLTAVGSFTEVVTFVNADQTMATFSLAPVQAANSFFELYYNPAVVADSLAGTGFNQGTLILAAKPSTTSESVGLFTLSTGQTGPPFPALDQFGSTNHYPGTTTVSGSGSALINADVTYFNPAFFLTPVIRLSFNSSIVTPFAQVNPSASFTSQPGGGPPNITANTGPINGVTGPDFQFQADPNISFTIPEPTSIILAGLGFASIVCLHVWTKK